MITLRPIIGVNPFSGQLQPPQRGPTEHIYDGERCIGVCRTVPGGSAALLVPISESLEVEVRVALDLRDGRPYPERLIKLSPYDPRNTCNVLTR